MIDSMHQSWLSQVVKAVYRSGSDADAMSIFRRIEPAYITAARWGFTPEVSFQKIYLFTQNTTIYVQRFTILLKDKFDILLNIYIYIYKYVYYTFY